MATNLQMPAMLYKPNGTMLEWDGEMFDYLIVNDEEEAEIALSDGWSIGKPKNEPAKPARGKPKAEE